MDLVSLSIWFIVAIFIIPSAKYLSPSDARDILLTVVVIYSILTGIRIYIGINNLKNTQLNTSEIAI